MRNGRKRACSGYDEWGVGVVRVVRSIKLNKNFRLSL